MNLELRVIKVNIEIPINKTEIAIDDSLSLFIDRLLVDGMLGFPAL